MKYGFIGFGHLGQAIYQGLKSEPIMFAYTSKTNEHNEIPAFDSIKELATFADVIWICVKPIDLGPVLEKLRAANLGKKMIVSAVAGKSIRFIEGYIGGDITIARIMPNLAMAYGKSVTAYADNSETELTKTVMADLKKLGKVVEIEERHFDIFTALFGSGPAFLLEILNVLKKKTAELGLSESLANELLTQLVQGTMSYLEASSPKSIPDLIDQIASKGGTTEAGLKSFRENKLDDLLGSVIEAARKRAQELG
jgi:pyrroline-5-carboxylate reductase